MAAGADALECDVHLTADGHVVVCHDDTVDRTTDGTGAIASLPVAALRELDAGARWSPDADPETANGRTRGGARPFAGAGHRIPLLADVLEAFSAMPIIVEFKSVAVAAAAVRILLDRGARERVLVGAFEHAALAAPRAAGFATVSSQWESKRLVVAALLGRRLRARPAFAAVAIARTRYGIPLPIGAVVRAVSVPVHVWTVNDPAHARHLWRVGARGIITDDPAAILAARRADYP